MQKEFKGRSPAYYAIKRFKRNKLAIAGFVLISVAFVISLLGYLILPDKTPNANNMILELETHSPGYTARLLFVERNSAKPEGNIFQLMLYGRENSYRSIPITDYHFEDEYLVVQQYAGFEGGSGLEEQFHLVDVVYAISGTIHEIGYDNGTFSFIDYDGNAQTVHRESLIQEIESNRMVNRTYWLGTDRFGRDMLSRLLLGTRVSLAVGAIAVMISLVIGLFIGSIGGFFRGGVDNFVMWLINVVWSIPALLLVIALTMVIGKGFWQVFVAVGLTMWVEIARIVRGQIISIREKEFVEAGSALGYSNSRIIIRHILPNIMGPVIVICAVNFATAILLEAGLSYLGVGVQPPMPSWGVMISDHFGYIVVDAAYLALLPSFAIVLMVLAFNLFGNGLRDAFDVQMR